MKSPLAAIAAMALSLVTPALGQAGNPGIRADVRLLAFAPDPRLQDVFIHDSAATPGAAAVATDVKTYLNHERTPLFLNARRFKVTTSSERESTERGDELLAEVNLPANLSTAILVFFPNGPDAETPFQVLVIDDSIRAFPAGSFRVSNISPNAVRITLEDKNFDFRPGDTVLIEDPPMRENHHTGMRAFAFLNNEWRRVATGLWPHPGERRAVQFLFQHPTTGQMQLRAFDDVPPQMIDSGPATVNAAAGS